VTPLDEIIAAFDVPPSACSELTPDEPGMLAVMRCYFETDEAGNSLTSPVSVDYAKWASQSEMDTYFDGDMYLPGYDETTWSFESSPSVTEGRLIAFQLDEFNGLDWTWEETLLSGEALSEGTPEDLDGWWSSIRHG
jgi:hypothetical protein